MPIPCICTVRHGSPPPPFPLVSPLPPVLCSVFTRILTFGRPFAWRHASGALAEGQGQGHSGTGAPVPVHPRALCTGAPLPAPSQRRRLSPPRCIPPACLPLSVPPTHRTADTFAELRDAKHKVEEDTCSRCFICGLDAYTFDRYVDGGFSKHTKESHNMWHYLYFMHHLLRKRKVFGSWAADRATRGGAGQGDMHRRLG